MKENQPGAVECTAALIVFACILGGMWILLFITASALIQATGH